MQNTVFVTGSDRGLGYALCAGFLAQGWCVYAGQYMPDWPDLALLAQQFPEALRIVPLDVNTTVSAQAAAQAVARSTDHVDLLINNAGVISPSQQISIRELQDTGDIHRLFDTNAVGPLRIVTAFLPLMDRGALKRLCFLSSEAGSIERSTRKAWYGY